MTTRPRIALTSTGKALAAMGIFLLLAAGNTGNNLLFLLTAGLCSLLVVGVAMGILNLLDLELTWEKEVETVVGTAASISLRIRETGQRARFLLTFGGMLLPALERGKTAFLPMRVQTLRRGCLAIDGLELISNFPLGLFRISRPLPVAIVWSFPVPLFASLAGAADALSISRLDTADRSGDFWMLSPYQPGQDCRNINWTISARSDMEWVVSQSVPQSDPFRVWLDTSALGDESIEPFLGLVAGLFLRARSQHSALFAWCAEPGGVPGWVAARDPGGCSRLLRWLAILQPGASQSPPPTGPDQGSALRLHPKNFGTAIDNGVSYREAIEA